MTTVLPPAGFRGENGYSLDVQNVSGSHGPLEETLSIDRRSHRLTDDAIQVPGRWLTVSPYLERDHQLDLESIDTPNRLLALALRQLQPATTEYAKVRYDEALDWRNIMSTLRILVATEGYRWTRHSFYVVEFRSKLKQNVDVDLLFKLDKESHVEATKSGGLLKYWYGTPDTERRNLATCLWRSRDDAINGGLGPWHKQARAAIVQMYEEIDVKGLRLTIDDDVSSWSFGPYSESRSEHSGGAQS
ncbi:hypothetical protein A1O1_05475 [Capronia coronata CBS 617.96]|uniref:Uncharacterized protein n=1 Tax=Capronia coronata CBS 617.96 TaxID=1182541 RepID=W9YFU9_9EURO|nr:uncharacterized protein A1O1_05475 [Capronia coronata CBS 617.96]EXJ88545.1 hypothetical protein A1O1_05475 [Capronia coronata CBS 617.96]